MSKRTVQKGLRSSSSQALSPPPNIRQRIIERMQKLMKEALNGNQLDDRYLFVLDYLSTVVGFQNASDQKTKDSFLIQLGKNEERGHSLGFDREELSSLNFLVLQVKTGGQLPVLEQRIKKKFQ